MAEGKADRAENRKKDTHAFVLMVEEWKLQLCGNMV